VNTNITYLHNLKLSGKVDVATADNLINDQRLLGNNLLDQQKLLIAQGGAPEQHIVITGGLPELPGTNIILPNLNGHRTIDEQGHLLPDNQAQSEEPKPSIPTDTSLPVNHEDHEP
jgi:hypothetical protein